MPLIYILYGCILSGHPKTERKLPKIRRYEQFTKKEMQITLKQMKI